MRENKDSKKVTLFCKGLVKSCTPLVFFSELIFFLYLVGGFVS